MQMSGTSSRWIWSLITAAGLLTGGWTATPASVGTVTSASQTPPFLSSARFTQWGYPDDVTEPMVREVATSLTQSGINTLLTEEHRSLYGDWPLPAERRTSAALPLEEDRSFRATRLVTRVLHEHGIRVIHHITSTFCTEDFARRHPDWLQRDARTGEPVVFDQYGRVWMLCLNNPDFRRAFGNRLVDFTRGSGVDGWMIDEVEWLPDYFSCGCGWCRAKFRKETGHTLPAGRESDVWENMESPVWRAWLRFRMRSAGDFVRAMRERLEAEWPGMPLSGCIAGASQPFLSQSWGMDAQEQGRFLNLPFYESWIPPARPALSWRRSLAEMDLYTAIARPHGNPPLTLFYPGRGDEARACWMLTALAGHRCWAMTEQLPLYAPWLRWEAALPFLSAPREPVADLALLFSSQTRDSEGETVSLGLVNDWAGWAETLTEGNIPHRVILDGDLTSGTLSRYAAVVAPVADSLSDGQIRVLLDYVEGGGRLIATACIGKLDEHGTTRSVTPELGELRKRIRDVPQGLGSLALTGWVPNKASLYPKDRSSTATAAILLTVAPEVSRPHPWRMDAPVGVAGRFYTQADGSRTLHVFNGTGADRYRGKEVKEGEALSLFPSSVENVTFAWRAKSGEQLQALWYADLSTEGQQLTVKENGEEVVVNLPAFREYGVLHLVRKAR